MGWPTRCLGVVAVLCVGVLGVSAGASAAGVVVKNGETLTLAPAGVRGGVTVQPGGALDVFGGSISGPLRANGAAHLVVCGARITGPVEVINGTGFIALGAPLFGCAGNRITGPLNAKGNKGGGTIENNSVSGPLTVMGNSPPIQVNGNEATGPSRIERVAAFTIEKLQKISTESMYTTHELTAEVGQTVDYEISVSNTGNVALTYSNFMDPNCENVKAFSVEPGFVTYECEHTLTAPGTYVNEASIEGNEGTGTKTSNAVVVNVLP